MPPASIRLAELTWPEAAEWLTPQALVMIPLGAAAKQHGPHLRLDNDQRMAEALAERVMAQTAVVVAPTVSYHHYPAFGDYPGSVSLTFATARDLLVDIVRSLAAFGPRRFYVLNTGVSTGGPLQAAAEVLRGAGIALHFTDIVTVAADTEHAVSRQAFGSHADEVETSIMLHVAAERVEMHKAVRDGEPGHSRGGFSRRPASPGIYSPSGVCGDATLADAEKGRRIVAAMVEGIVRDIERLRREPV